MTRKELEVYSQDVTQKYQNLLALLVALTREQGAVTISRALVDDQIGQWMITTTPSDDGAVVMVSPRLVGAQPDTLIRQ